MAMLNTDDRPFPATPRRRQQAVREGQIGRSYELGSALALLGACATFSMWGQQLSVFFEQLVTHQLGDQPDLTARTDTIVFQLRQLCVVVGITVGPILGLLLLLTIASHGVQVGFLWLPHKLKPDWSRLDPVQGFQQRFQVAQLIRFLIGTWRLILGLGIAIVMLWQERVWILQCLSQHPADVAGELLQFTVRILTAISGMLVAVGLGDYLYQRWRHEQALRMTAEELREELRHN